jgi:DNA-binding FadR family transcriptional regulator
VHYLHLEPGAGKATVRQHGAIVAAIADGDPDAAGRAMAAHLAYLRDITGSEGSGSGEHTRGAVAPSDV